MENKIYTVAVIGIGGRGYGYSSKMHALPDKFKLVAGCDLLRERRNNFVNDFNVSPDAVFEDENDFFKEKRADVLVIATMDRDHVRHALKGLELGYDILCEKPISDSEEECYELLKAQEKYGKKIMVCHVLRYAPAFTKVKELLNENAIGELVMIDDMEQVHYLHQAHSFVRGNWRNKEETSPMILQKCCHDLDLLQWYAGSECETISSIGDLRFFTAKNQPEGGADRCTDCKYFNTCAYSAKMYLDGFWGVHAVLAGLENTQENVMKCIKEGPYGRCAFKCDNDVVDNEIVMMRFKNGVTANLRMTAFTASGGRIIKFYGTYGEIDLNEEEGYVKLRRFGKEEQSWSISSLCDAVHGHGGGDDGIIAALYEYLSGNATGETTLAGSIESHKMAFAAEKSRVDGGSQIKF